MEGIGSLDPVAIARLSITRRQDVTKGLVVRSVRIGDRSASGRIPHRVEESGMEDWEDVVALDRGHDVFGSANDLRQPFLHLLTGKARIVFQSGRREGGDDRSAFDVRCRSAQLLDHRKGGCSKAAVVSPDLERLVEILECLVKQYEARRRCLQQLDHLNCGCAEQAFVLRPHSLVHLQSTQAVRKVTEERPDDQTRLHLLGVRTNRRTVQNCDGRLRQRPTSQESREVTAETSVGDLRR